MSNTDHSADKRVPGTSERREQIIQRLRQHGSVQVNDLSELFGVSTVTIRNDLAFLENLCTIHDEALLLSYEFSLDSLALRCRGILGQKRDLRESASFVCKLSSSALMVSGVRCPFWS